MSTKPAEKDGDLMSASTVRSLAFAAVLFMVGGEVCPVRVDAQIAIESTVFEYQALAGNANNINQQILTAINPAKHPHPQIVVATSGDIGTIVRLETTLGQAEFVDGRLRAVLAALESPTVFQCRSSLKIAPVSRGQRKGLTASTAAPPPSAPASPETGGLLGVLFNNASAILALAQTAQLVGSVSETVAPAAGTLSDMSLIGALAGDLNASGATAFVPSIYPPRLAKQTFKDTLIGSTLDNLEKLRATVNDTANTRILSPQCQYTIPETAPDKKVVKTIVNLAVINQITVVVVAANALLDTFEAQLFGGSASAKPPIAGVPQPATAPAAPAPGGAASSTAPSPLKPAASAPPSSGTAVQELLYADLTLQQLGATRAHPVISDEKNVYFVSVHSVDSGGNTLSQAGFFGTRVFYSGGAVSIFSVFDANAGTLLCSGVSYAYRGSVSQNQMQLAINDAQNPGQPVAGSSPPPSDALPAPGYFTTRCPVGS